MHYALSKATCSYDFYEILLFNSGLWGLVNNAGIAVVAPLEWIPLEKSKHIADVNLWGMIDITKTFLPLIKNTQGRVVNFSSMLGKLRRRVMYLFLCLKHTLTSTSLPPVNIGAILIFSTYW